MHRQVREHLEEVLTGPSSGTKPTVGEHLAECRECGGELDAMREQAALIRQLRAPADQSEEVLNPRPGFYARVLERIEAEGAGSIWSLFFESVFGRRLAVASLALAVLLAICLVSTERFFGSDSESAFEAAQGAVQMMPELRGQVVVGEDQPGVVLTGAPDQDSVLVNLVTYREQ